APGLQLQGLPEILLRVRELPQLPAGKAAQHVQPDEVRALAQAGSQAVPGGAGVAGTLEPQRTDGKEVTGPEMVGLFPQGVLEVAQRRRELALPLPVVA